MAEAKTKLASVDPVWSRVCDEAVEAIKAEPLMGGMIHSSLLHHATMERALAYRFSLKLASGEMSEQILREIEMRLMLLIQTLRNRRGPI